MRNLGLYEHIVNILKFDAETFSERREKKSNFFEEKNLIIIILQKCYIVLAKFMANNEENQNLIKNSILDIYITHLKTVPEIHLSFFIENLMKNNKEFLQDHEILSKTLKNVVKIIDKLPVKNQNKANYLECLKVLTKFKNK